MDYEKKYNDALAWMRELYPGLHGATKEDAEHYFPELRESEDERVRALLVSLVQWAEIFPQSGLDSDTTNKMLSYLEKQKEQKPVISDEAIRDGVVHFGITQYQIDNWLKKHINIVEQKPAEWSEEDEKKMIFLERLIKYNVPDGQYGWADGRKGGFVTKSEAISMLKSLRPQPKQEWSEKDEKKIHFLSRLIEFQVKDGEYCFGEGACAISKQEAIEMLQSLRPSWKPSDEQMEAFRSVLEHEAERVGSSKHLEKANSLYEQLKKL